MENGGKRERKMNGMNEKSEWMKDGGKPGEEAEEEKGKQGGELCRHRAKWPRKGRRGVGAEAVRRVFAAHLVAEGRICVL
jgi:hypothetical protein